MIKKQVAKKKASVKRVMKPVKKVVKPMKKLAVKKVVKEHVQLMFEKHIKALHRSIQLFISDNNMPCGIKCIAGALRLTFKHPRLPGGGCDITMRMTPCDDCQEKMRNDND